MSETQIYKVKDPEGNIREIRGPAGASDQEIITQAQRLFQKPAPVKLGREGMKEALTKELEAAGPLVRNLVAMGTAPSNLWEMRMCLARPTKRGTVGTVGVRPIRSCARGLPGAMSTS